MLSNNIKYYLKSTRGWCVKKIMLHYGCNKRRNVVSAIQYVNSLDETATPAIPKTIYYSRPNDLFSGKHYMELTFEDLTDYEKDFYESATNSI